MRIISIINPKGGCGKTTLATSLAAKLTCDGYTVALRDMDRQMSAHDWCKRRPKGRPPISSLSGSSQQMYHLTFGRDFVIHDTQSAVYGYELLRLLAGVDIVVVPVGPSTLDFEISTRVFEQLKKVPRVASGRCKLLCVGNRWSAATTTQSDFSVADRQLRFSAVLSEHSAYVRAVSEGLGVLELDFPGSENLHVEWAAFLSSLKSSPA